MRRAAASRTAVITKWAGATPSRASATAKQKALRRYASTRGAKVSGFNAGSGQFTGIAAAYGVVDEYGSLWLPGCFNDSMNERMPVICWGHDWTEPVGRAVDWSDQPHGLIITGQLDDPNDVPRARQAWSQLRSGTLGDLSVGFSHTMRREPTPDEVQQFPGVREVIESAQLDEVSIVLRGAVPGAQVTGTRVGAAVGLRGSGVDAALAAVGAGRSERAPRVSGWNRPNALTAEAERRRKARGVRP